MAINIKINNRDYFLDPSTLSWGYYKNNKRTTVRKLDKPINFTYSPFDYFMVVTTNRCNTNCDYCFRDLNPDKNKEITFQEFAQIVDFFCSKSKNHKILQLTGGEVFLRKDIMKWITYAMNKGFKVWLASNALHKQLLNPDVLNLFSKNPQGHIRISLDGHDAASHEFFRQKGTFQVLSDRFDILTEKQISYDVKSVISHHNFHQIEDILEFCHAKGVGGWNYNVFRFTGKCEDHFNSIKIGHYQIFEKLHEIICRKPYLAPLLKITRFGKILDSLHSMNPTILHNIGFVVNHDCNVYANDNLFVDEYCLGNYREAGTSVFDEAHIKRARQNLDSKLQACQQCSIQSFCCQKGDYGELYAEDATLSSEFNNCDDLKKAFYFCLNLDESGKELFDMMNCSTKSEDIH